MTSNYARVSEMVARLWGGSPLAQPTLAIDGPRCVLRHQNGVSTSFELTRADCDLSNTDLEARVVGPAVETLRANVRAKSAKPAKE